MFIKEWVRNSLGCQILILNITKIKQSFQIQKDTFVHIVAKTAVKTLLQQNTTVVLEHFRFSAFARFEGSTRPRLNPFGLYPDFINMRRVLFLLSASAVRALVRSV